MTVNQAISAYNHLVLGKPKLDINTKQGTQQQLFVVVYCSFLICYHLRTYQILIASCIPELGNPLICVNLRYKSSCPLRFRGSTHLQFWYNLSWQIRKKEQKKKESELLRNVDLEKIYPSRAYIDSDFTVQKI